MVLVRLDRQDAENFLRRYDHLGNVGLGVWHWGVISKENLVGVVSYGVPCFARSRGWLGGLAIKHRLSLLQLCRGATIDQASHCAPSRLISLANEVMQELHGPLLFVAYANEDYS